MSDGIFRRGHLAALAAALLLASCFDLYEAARMKPDGGDADTDGDADADSLDPILNCDGGRYDEASGLCWQHPKPSEAYSSWEAIDYCDSLDLAGHTDWYLPSRDDFIDLLGGCDVDVLGGSGGSCNSCANSPVCSALFGPDDDWHWSSSPCEPDGAWFVSFSGGVVDCDSIDGEHSYRCVREGP